ncbi:regulator of G-protein signaling 7-like isoform X2 [Gigantopelta aegis]|uniref:regulator of G-protein signaling 7-like isoform X2 n=1 Tax=Gigantopelta aegis TaxID=1735272 RepID=UPI001B88940B|nr:regulator of G-protein signaling 7-like isoform X2 [Gigantopelta aegis]
MTISSETMDMDQNHKQKPMVYQKLESIMQEMQHPKTGVPVKSQKTFLSTIPSVFTGYDLVTWLRHRLNIPEDETQDALHLATILCQYGYLFPVTDAKNHTVKGDISLYRFQCPFYWPSQNMEPDNVTYAIYLTKRSSRNKQKHGLDEHEQTAFNKLQKMLVDKWEMIRAQAQEQIRIAKDRKKMDKRIHDSQERAFWKIHRPPPGQMKFVEEGAKRNFQPHQIRQRKKNKDFLLREINYLRNAVNRSRIRTSKAIETYLLWFEHYEDNDPFITSVKPSNPWMSDDTTFWDLCNDYIETPTERRVKRWAISFHELLNDATGREEFEKFLKKEYSQENIRFWKACEDLKFCPQSEVRARIEQIYLEFLTHGSAHEVNLDGKTMEIVQKYLKENRNYRFTFEAAQEHIFLLMKKDSYARFLRSDQYKALLVNAIQPEGKKKFFNFGSSRKKNLTPSPQPNRRSSGGGDSADGSSNVAHHSYSTGNLKDLDDKVVIMRKEQNSSDSSLPRCESSSPLMHRKSKAESPRRSKLEVPKHLSVNFGETSKGDAPTCLALAVPTKTNIVAPWDGPE